jgi:hypothetical protein
MKKNVASQVVGAQLVNATTGAAFTSSVTVSVTGDGGTQAAGSVGSGACTHEGNGFHTYLPAQAETNYDHVAFTFTGTGAVPVTVQIYTTFPQTGDNYARLGAPAGASVSADVAAVKAVLPAALVSGRIDASVGAMATGVLTATAIAADAITDAKVASDVTIASVTGSVGSVTGAVGSIGTGGIATTSFAAGAIDATAIASSAIGNTQLANNAIGASKIASDAITAAKIDTTFGTEVATAVWAATTRLLTAGTNIALAKGTGVTGFNDLDAAGVRAAVGLATASLDTTLDATISSRLSAAGYTAPDNASITAVKSKTDSLTFTTAGMVDSAIKRVGNTTLTAAGTGGQGYGG